MTDGFVKIKRSDVSGFDGPMIAVWYRLNDWALWEAGARVVAGVRFALEPGQLVTTLPLLAKSLGFGRQVVRRCLTALAALGRIETRSRHRTATIITVKGYGERHIASSVVVPSLAEEPTSMPTSTPSAQIPPVPLDPRPFHGVPDIGETASQPQAQPPSKKEATNNSKTLNPPSSEATRSNEGEGGSESADSHVSDLEADLIAYAQMRLSRIAGAKECLSFVETWRSSAAPWLTVERMKADIDWLATHPIARSETRSITRAFFVKQARQSYADWDGRLVRLVDENLRQGVPIATIADRVVEATRHGEPEVMRAYVLRVGALFAPPVPERALA